MCGSYIETIRPVAEVIGIAKIVPPEGWKPPDTPMKDHINKLLPTKKQALHCLMNVRLTAQPSRVAGVGGFSTELQAPVPVSPRWPSSAWLGTDQTIKQANDQTGCLPRAEVDLSPGLRDIARYFIGSLWIV